MDFENQDRLNFLKEKVDEISLDRILTSLDVLNDYCIKINNSSNTDILSEVLVLRLIDTVDTNSLRSRVEKLERLDHSNIVDTINSIINVRLENFNPVTSKHDRTYDLEEIGPNKSDDVVDNHISNVGEIVTKTSIGNDISEGKDGNDISEDKESSKSISIDPHLMHDIREMVVSTSGTMLNTIFNDEGFNYEYNGSDFVLIIKDEFYRIFIETKIDEISEKLSAILNKDISFFLETRDSKEAENIERDSKQSQTIDKLKKIFDEELSIK